MNAPADIGTVSREIKPRIVLVEPDAQVRSAMAVAAVERGIELVGCGTARAGLNAACALEPSCVVTALTLPDIDGVWLTETLRGQPAPVSLIPILLIAAVDDEATRVSALDGGVDAVFPKTLSAREIVAQVAALLRFGARSQDRREAPAPLRAPASGDLDRMPIALVLRALEQERRNGELFLRPIGLSTRRLVLSMAGGLLAGGVLDGIALPPLDALRTALEWSGRRFEFTPGGNRTPPPGALGVSALLREALAPVERRKVTPPPMRSPTPPPQDVFDAAGLGDSARPSRPPAEPMRRSKSMTMMAPGKDLVETVVRRPDPRSDADEPAPPPPPRHGIKW